MASLLEYILPSWGRSIAMPSGVMEFPDAQKLKISDWLKYWQNGETPWHFKTPNHLLGEYFNMLFKDSSNVRVLVPLCGKSVDLKWLLSRGCQVTGVEVSEIGIREFFKEQEIEFKQVKINDVTVFEAVGHSLTMYCCDFLDMDKIASENQFDLVWDRNAFVAINEDDRQKYVHVIRKMCHPKSKLFFSAFEYDRKKYPGPPHSFNYHDLQTYFGPSFTYEALKTREVLEDFRNNDWGLDWLLEHFYIMDPK